MTHGEAMKKAAGYIVSHATGINVRRNVGRDDSSTCEPPKPSAMTSSYQLLATAAALRCAGGPLAWPDQRGVVPSCGMGPFICSSLGRLLPVALALLLAPLTGCLETSGRAPLRSPSYDYRPPPPTTSDGQVIGADRRAPADKLAEGPTNTGAAPGWKIDPHGVHYDPKARAGGAIDRSDSESPSVAPSPQQTKPPR